MSTETVPARQDAILLVENDVLVRMAISDFLRSCGYRVVEAGTAEEALALVAHAGIRIDVVLSDVEMPGSLDGFGLATWIRKNRPGLDVILAGSVPRSVNAAARLCDQRVVSKPYEAQGLLEQIQRLLAARAARQGA